jgi:hypothetical protein
MEATALSYSEILTALERQPLFEDKTWKLSPEPFPLTLDEVALIEEIGVACLDFHRALELLYLRSVEDKNLLRNKSLKAPWVAGYLDRGKPEKLIKHARSKRLRGEIPLVIRPDLLLTDNGFALTEIDSVPGGIGLTAFLAQLYYREGIRLAGDADADSMIIAFYDALASRTENNKLPLIAILVSDEASTYRPEMQWLAEMLQQRGKRVYCFHHSEIMPLGNTLCASVDGNPEKIDVIYRFWELFDLANIPLAEHILEAWEDSQLVVTPPMRPFQEEKLSLALFHHHLLEEFWRENLPKSSYKLLRKIIPNSWIMDPVDLPPNAVLDAPYIGGKPMTHWEQLGDASQKERNLIIKMSGFHEEAWGARSVLLGSDVSRTDWQKGISNALSSGDRNLYLLQEYHKPKRLKHSIYQSPDVAEEVEGRLRLSPYYFVKENKTKMAGILATFCPADKKIIHGMRDGAMLPCQVVG